jgi:hypothetical protein
MPELEVLSPSSPQWQSRLETVPHDFYHTAAYHRLAEDCGGGDPLLAVYGSRDKFLAWPYVLRPLNELPDMEHVTCTDIASVYGYPGPVGRNCNGDATFLSRAWSALVELWRGQQAITVFTRFHPLLENHELLIAGRSVATPNPSSAGGSAEAGLLSSGQTISIDLTLTDEESLRGYHKILRQEVASGRRRGLQTREDVRWESVDEFLAVYLETMVRNRAASHYFFDADYIHRLHAALTPYAHLFVTRLDQRLAAAAIVVEYRGIVQAHLAGSSDELKALSPLKVLLDDVRRWAQERGNRILHLGGGRGARDDSLLAFKARFSSRRHQFYVGRWILDPAVYAFLCAQRLQSAQGAGIGDADDFFPPYRASSCGMASQCEGETPAPLTVGGREARLEGEVQRP